MYNDEGDNRWMLFVCLYFSEIEVKVAYSSVKVMRDATTVQLKNE
jgi:hypothetical protein